MLTFVLAAVALALLAHLVGTATEQLGSRLGSGGASVVQSALGNLPELFIALFALNDGLIAVVQAALVGSILANSVLVLGIAFVVGGLRNGPQRFRLEPGADDLDPDHARGGDDGDSIAGQCISRAGGGSWRSAVARLRRRAARALRADAPGFPAQRAG